MTKIAPVPVLAPRYAIINAAGVVMNFVRYSSAPTADQLPKGFTAVELPAGSFISKGDVYTGGAFVVPPTASTAPIAAKTASAATPATATCKLWQLATVMSPSQWGQMLGVADPITAAFLYHGGSEHVSSSSATFQKLAAAASLTPAQFTSLVAQAAKVTIP